MSDRDKKWLEYALLVIVIVVAGYFGIRYPLPEMPEFVPPEGIGLQAVGPTRFRSIMVDHIATIGDDLVVIDDASVGGDLTVTGDASWSCSTATITESLNLSGTLTAQDVMITDTLIVSGTTTLSTTLAIDGNISSHTGAVTITDSLQVTDTADFDSTVNIDGATTMGSTASVGGNITFENGTTLGEAVDTVLDFSEFLAATEQTAISVTTQAYLTPTGTYQPLTSAAAVSTSLTTAIMSGTVAGQLLILANENITDAITLVDAANTQIGGDKELGPTDAIFLMWNLVDWICIGYNDN